MTPVAGLTHEAKVRLVTVLAQFSGPTEAARVISQEFGVTVDRRTAWKFDPTKSGCTTSSKYRQLFHEIRDRWLNDMAAIPIAKQGHRLRLLDRLAHRLEDEGDYTGALKAIEQAAKEVGGIFINDKRVTVPVLRPALPLDGTDARAQLATRLSELLERQSV